MNDKTLESAQERPALRVGIDIGGTFTDIQLVDGSTGEVFEYKTPTTPSDPSIGLVAGLRGVCAFSNRDVADIALILHGTTIATNAVLEDKMAKGAFITTAGFEDVLEIGRSLRRDVYGLYAETRRLLVPRHMRFGLKERIDVAGTVLTPLDEGEVRALGRRLAADGVPVVGVALLGSFANPVHELRVREILAEVAPDLLVSLSCELTPEIREYERSSTTALNALLMPIVRGYADKLQCRVAEEKLDARILLVQSNGGTAGPVVAGNQPARLLLSGPCGGTVALEQMAQRLDMPNLVGMDIGGTSCDVSVVENYHSTMVTEGFVDGCSVRLPMVDVRTIGAGGGSIARIDDLGRLRVGPESAGAVPGPVCYQRGGELPTVTDANLVLGRLGGGGFLKGAMQLDADGAREAVRKHVAAPLGLGVEDSAEGILQLLVTAMVAEIRLTLFERGLNPADFTLVSFGGAGGLHATMVAEELNMRSVLFPNNASTLSAFGMLWTDVKHDHARSRILPVVADSVAAIREIISTLIADGRASLLADEIPEALHAYRISLDMRYRGQGFELTVPLGDGAATGFDAATLAQALADFHAQHQQRFSFSDLNDPVELVTLRLSALGMLQKPTLTTAAATAPVTAPETRKVYASGKWHEVPVVPRAAIVDGTEVIGPAVIDETYTTLFIGEGWTVSRNGDGDLVGRR